MDKTTIGYEVDMLEDNQSFSVDVEHVGNEIITIEFYGDGKLTAEETQRLIDWLAPLIKTHNDYKAGFIKQADNPPPVGPEKETK